MSSVSAPQSGSLSVARGQFLGRTQASSLKGSACLVSRSTRRVQHVMAQVEGTGALEKREPLRVQQSDLKTYQVPEGRLLDILVMTFGTAARVGSGLFVDGYSASFGTEPRTDEYRPLRPLGYEQIAESSKKIVTYKRPEKLIEIYEFEACPFCRKVREAACILDLDVRFYPTPKGAPHHRSKSQELGGKQSYPFMVDPNTGKSMYESDDIVAYLFNEYGDGNVPLSLKLGLLTTLTCGICSLTRLGHGTTYRKAKYPEEPLVFWGYELSPFSKFVREVLVELELPFTQIYCARGSPKRQKFYDEHGAFQVPYLEDPNTGVAMFESDQIIKYLEETYAL